MDAHFRTLGLPRGCDEEAVRKAYRQCALKYHPDRNPNGADTFKRIQASYEAVTQHLKAHGGRDVVTTTRTGSGSSGSAYTYARQQQRHGGGRGTAYADAPLFTEEELFGGDGVPGGFSSESRRGGGGAGANTSSSGRDRRTSASYAHTTAHFQADAHWKRAHGSRVPVSGYAGDGAGAPPRPGQTGPTPAARAGARSQFATRGGGAAEASQSSRCGEEESESFKEMYAAYLARGGGGRAPSHHVYEAASAEDELAQEKIRAMWRDLDQMHSPEEKQAALKASWAALQRDIGRKMGHQKERQEQQQQQQQQQQQHTSPPQTSSESTYERVEREMAAQAEAARREWQAKRDAFLRQEEEAREAARKRAAEDILRRHEEQQRQRAAFDAAQAERAAASEKHMDTIGDERRMLTRQLFYQKYTPEAAEVGDMTDMQVYVLNDLLRKTQERVEKVLQARLARGPCSRCQKRPKETSRCLFTCAHACVCRECGVVAQQCPLCGAHSLDRRDAEADGAGEESDARRSFSSPAAAGKATTSFTTTAAASPTARSPLPTSSISATPVDASSTAAPASSLPAQRRLSENNPQRRPESAPGVDTAPVVDPVIEVHTHAMNPPSPPTPTAVTG